MSKFVEALGLRSDVDRLAEVRSKGGRLDILDEQRLRDHQLRRLRRLWLKDQCLTEREPLLPPEKKTFYGELKAKEAKFWGGQFKMKNIIDYFYLGKNYNEIPKLFLFKVQRAIRVSFVMLLPSIPMVYYLKHMNTDRDIPQNLIMEKIPIFPGEETITGKLSEIYLDPHTATFKKKTDN